MQEEVTSKTIAFYVQTTKMTANVLRAVLRKYLESQNHKKQVKKTEEKTGKITLKELVKQNAGTSNIEITSKNIKSFERVAREFEINYALKKDNTRDPPVYLVFFKARDQDALMQAFRKFTYKETKRSNKQSIRKRLTAYKDILAKRDQQKSKDKKQELDR